MPKGVAGRKERKGHREIKTQFDELKLMPMTRNSTNRLLIATGNRGKVLEIRELLSAVPIAVKSLADFTDIVEVEETGSTFAENAALKAVGYAAQTGMLSLADDSGLEVAALGGRPGVLSARYGGEDLDFPSKMDRLLAEMDDSAIKTREARFVCSMVLADAKVKILAEADGECRGKIARKPRGNGGFGYDPIFIPNGHELTFGELSKTIKGKISHRSLAAEKIKRYLLDFTGIST